MGHARRAREAERANNKVIIGTVHPGTVSTVYTASLVMSLMYDVATSRSIAGWLNEWSSANISSGRNAIVEQFLVHDSQADWLLFVDADMEFMHTAVEQLLAVADPETVPIVGGLCFGAVQNQLFPTIYQLGRTDDGRPTTIRVGNYPHDQLVQCAATGTAFLMIHRGVLLAMRDRAFNQTFPWFQETELAGQPVGEDITFCLRAGQMGLRVHVDTRVKVGHHKSTIYTEAMFDAQHANDPEPVSEEAV